MTKPIPVAVPDTLRPLPIPEALCRDKQTEQGPGNRTGRLATGLYPDLDRTKLAKAIGRDPATISAILSGRFTPGLALATTIAGALETSLERLSGDLAEQSERYWRRKRAGAKTSASTRTKSQKGTRKGKRN